MVCGFGGGPTHCIVLAQSRVSLAVWEVAHCVTFDWCSDTQVYCSLDTAAM